MHSVKREAYSQKLCSVCSHLYDILGKAKLSRREKFKNRNSHSYMISGRVPDHH